MSDKTVVKEKSWKEFQESGMLWMTNTILQVFGWSIVIDQDKLVNRGDKEFSVTSNAAIAQGIFLEYGITDDDDAKATRNGGFGSTDKNE